MNICDEPLVDELVNSVEGFKDYVGGEVDQARVVHDEDGISFSTFEYPLSFDGRVGDTRDAPVDLDVLD